MLAAAFGGERLTKLLNSGALALDCAPYAIGNYELSPLRYRIVSVRNLSVETAHDFYGRIRRKLAENMRRTERLKLENAVTRSLVIPPENFLKPVLRGVRRDVAANVPSLHKAAVLAVPDVTGKEIPADALELRFHQEGDDDYYAETNLLKLGVSAEDAHKIGRSALFAIAGTEQKLAQMQTFKAIA